MNYYEEDFVETNYRHLLNRIKEKTIFYNEINLNEYFTLWRHDVDFSAHRALALAKIEHEKNLKVTYFFQLGSMYYNIFEQTIKEKIFKIKQLGHEIALHFDPTQYRINSKDDLEKYLNYEKEILENLFDIKINVFSFHNPTIDILLYDEWKYAGLINTYAKYFKDNVEYCSDSNGYWRYKRLGEFLSEDFTKIQVLTHPVWWQKDLMYPRNRVQRCIDGRSKNTLEIYDKLLEEHGRKNVR